MTKEKLITATAWKNKGNGQILITLPRDKFKAGDVVAVKKVKVSFN